jgi:omega-amidase
MKNDLQISLLQLDLRWENPQSNYDLIEKKIASLPIGQDIIILPEMFTTGFTMNTSVAEEFSPEMTSLQKMREWSEKTNAAISGSISVKEGSDFFNRLFFVRPDGTFEYYDKRHLFRLSDENNYFTKGKDPKVIEWRTWRIKPLICYDLRFPVWSRNYIHENEEADYDFLFYVASWPAIRSFPWKSLLTARAIENQVYCAGVNRCGKDGAGFDYNGDSLVFDPLGEIIGNGGSEESVVSVKLSAEELKAFRKKFPVLKDGDSFELK